jgi:hypothetical protein
MLETDVLGAGLMPSPSSVLCSITEMQEMQIAAKLISLVGLLKPEIRIDVQFPPHRKHNASVLQ